MKSEELRGKLKKIGYMAYIRAGIGGISEDEFADTILSLLETAITEAEPKDFNPNFNSYEGTKNKENAIAYGMACGYNQGKSDYKSNLLALVRGEK